MEASDLRLFWGTSYILLGRPTKHGRGRIQRLGDSTKPRCFGEPSSDVSASSPPMLGCAPWEVNKNKHLTSQVDLIRRFPEENQ